MRRVVPLMAFVVLIAAAPARADIPELAAGWHLDSNGASSPDSSGHGLNATKVGSPTAVSPARFGNGLKFPTESDYLNAGNHAGLQPAHVTAMAWVRSPSTPPTVKGIISQGSNGSCSFSSYSLYTGGSAMSDIGTRFYVHTAGGTVKTTAVNNASVWNNQWHLLTGTYDGTTARIYIDGNLAGSGTGPAGPIAYGLGLNNDFIIGGALDPACVEQTNFNGDMDEVRVYNRALSAEEIAYLARADHTTPPQLPIPVAPPPPPAGRNVTAPHVELGGLQSGRRLYSCPGATWQNLASPPGFEYAWWRVGGPTTADTKVQSGASDQFLLPTADIGKTFYCQVTARGLNGQPVSAFSPKRILSGSVDTVTGGRVTAPPPAYGNVRIRGIDVYQVSQPRSGAGQFEFPNGGSRFTQYCGGGTPTTYFNFLGPVPCETRAPDSQLVTYQGVDLDQRKPATAMVYVDMAGAPATDRSLPLDVTLRFRLGRTLMKGQLTLQKANPAVSTTPYVTSAERGNSDYRVAFDIPPVYLAAAVQAGGKLTLEASVSLPVGAGGGDLTECSGTNCLADDNFRLDGIPVFDDLPELRIRSVPMLANTSQVMASPQSVMSSAVQIYPGGERMTILPYKGSIDISTAAALLPTDVACLPFVALGGIRSCKMAWVGAAMDIWTASDRENREGFDFLLGVHRYQSGAGFVEPGWKRGETTLKPGQAPQMAINDGSLKRPLTAAAHEFGHALGAPHADTTPRDATTGRCGGNDGGQIGETWPFDNTGRLQGVAFDRPRVRIDTAEFPVYDLMSYCGFEKEAWLSPYNWNRAFKVMRDFKAAQRRLARSGRLATPRGRSGQAFVAGIGSPAGARIVRVVPADPDNLVPEVDPGSPLRVRALDAAGKELAVVGAKLQLLTDVPGTYTFTAPVPAATATVELVLGAAVTDRKARTKPPTVRVLAPRAGTRVGGSRRSGLVVRWRASDPDTPALQANVEFAANGRTGWRSVFTGPSRGRATIPGSYLQRGSHARVRVRINDGFSEASAQSAAFRAEGPPPIARLLRPAAGESLQAGTRGVLLLGSGLDDAGHSLRGRSLTWFAGRRRLGSGERLPVSLPAGKVTLRLRVRDGAGRVGFATRRLRVAPVTLALSRLLVPDRVRPGARTAKATVSSTTAATFRVGGRSFRVSPKARRITIPLPARPRLGPLAVRYTVTARGARQRVLRDRIVVVRA